MLQIVLNFDLSEDMLFKFLFLDLGFGKRLNHTNKFGQFFLCQKNIPKSSFTQFLNDFKVLNPNFFLFCRILQQTLSGFYFCQFNSIWLRPFFSEFKLLIIILYIVLFVVGTPGKRGLQKFVRLVSIIYFRNIQLIYREVWLLFKRNWIQKLSAATFLKRQLIDQTFRVLVFLLALVIRKIRWITFSNNNTILYLYISI